MGTESYYNSTYNETYSSDGSITYYNSTYNEAYNSTYNSTTYYNSTYNEAYNATYGDTTYYNSTYNEAYSTSGATTYYNSTYGEAYTYGGSTYTPSTYSTYYYSDTYSPSTYYSSTYTPSTYSYSGSSYSSGSYRPSSTSSTGAKPSKGGGDWVGKVIVIVFAAIIAFAMIFNWVMCGIQEGKERKEKTLYFSVADFEHGSANVSTKKVYAGEEFTFSVFPDEGYFHAYSLVIYEGRENDDYNECEAGDLCVVFGTSFTPPFGGNATIIPVVLKNDATDDRIKVGEEDVEYDAALYFYGNYDTDSKKVYRNLYIYGLKDHLDKSGGYSNFTNIIINVRLEIAENTSITYEGSNFYGHDQTNSRQVLTLFNFDKYFSMTKEYALTYAVMDHAGSEVSPVYEMETAFLSFPISKLTNQMFMGFAIDKSYSNSPNDPSIAWKFKNMSFSIDFD